MPRHRRTHAYNAPAAILLLAAVFCVLLLCGGFMYADYAGASEARSPEHAANTAFAYVPISAAPVSAHITHRPSGSRRPQISCHRIGITAIYNAQETGLILPPATAPHALPCPRHDSRACGDHIILPLGSTAPPCFLV